MTQVKRGESVGLAAESDKVSLVTHVELAQLVVRAAQLFQRAVVANVQRGKLVLGAIKPLERSEALYPLRSEIPLFEQEIVVTLAISVSLR